MDEFYKQYLQQMQNQNKWSSPQNLINLATLGLSGISGLASGNAASRQADQSADQLAYQRAQDDYMRRLTARTGLESAIRGQLDDRSASAVNFLNGSPLGAEQDFANKYARLRGLSSAVENFQPSAPTDPNILRSYNPGPNLLSAFTSQDYRNSISPEATAASIAERRKALNAVNPDYQFGSMSAYGLPNSQDAAVEQSRQGFASDRLSRENQLYQLLVNQMQEASKPLYQGSQADPSQAQAAAQPEKKKGFWSKLGSALLPIAGVASNFLPGVGPILGTVLSGVGGAAGGALSGGLKGAILGGASGAAAGYGLNKAGLGMDGHQLNNAMSAKSLPVGNFVSPRVDGTLPNLMSSPISQLVGGVTASAPGVKSGGGGYNGPSMVPPWQTPPPASQHPFPAPVPSHTPGAYQPPQMAPQASHGPSPVQAAVLQGGQPQAAPAPQDGLSPLMQDPKTGSVLRVAPKDIQRYMSMGWRQLPQSPSLMQSIMNTPGFRNFSSTLGNDTRGAMRDLGIRQ